MPIYTSTLELSPHLVLSFNNGIITPLPSSLGRGKTVKLFVRPGPAVDEIDEHEEVTELCRAIVNRLIDSGVMSTVGKQKPML